MFTQTAFSRAPGKIILCGEQFVVLGAPAIAMAINLYSRVEARPMNKPGVEVDVDLPLKDLSLSRKYSARESAELLRPLRIAAEATLDRITKREAGVRVNVDCEIPVGAGLGSSASTTVAIASAVSRSMGTSLSREEIFKLAFVPERFLHGNPSGVDQATCIYGGVIRYKRPFKVEPLLIKNSPELVLCDTGIHHKTKTLVGSVVRNSKKNKEQFREHLEEVRSICQGVVKALKRGDDEDLGALMSRNHELLRKIKVSHPKLDRLVDAALKAGALGAKLTGAGGGGCIIAVCEDAKARQKISRSLTRQGGKPFKISRDACGVVSSLGRALK
ncbi:MAG TPA: mevalonate kinase [Candidatus Bathyarchaeia archaeon]|nr:mevalonate kinase [Candidatus Bathyarchaeia archaeon]